MAAASACGVPGNDAFTFSFGLSSGIFAKSGGRSFPGTNFHGPDRPGAENHRPVTRTYVRWSFRSLNTFAVVFFTYSSIVPSTDAHSGSPSVTTSSVGEVATTIDGTPFFREGAFFGSSGSGDPSIRSTTFFSPSSFATC
jgi:hypothetical protein